MPFSSGPHSFNAEDFFKTLKAFVWNFLSLLAVVIPLVLALPAEELPSQLLWIVPLAPTINAVLYGISRWYQDNR